MAYVSVHVDAEEFDDDELADELRSRGYMVTKGGQMLDSSAIDLPYIDHLAMCGLTSAARQEALVMVERAIGRSLTH